jgi:hypothetical protein
MSELGAIKYDVNGNTKRDENVPKRSATQVQAYTSVHVSTCNERAVISRDSILFCIPYCLRTQLVYIMSEQLSLQYSHNSKTYKFG